MVSSRHNLDPFICLLDTLELSSYVLEIPSNFYNADWLILGNNKEATLNICMPHFEVRCFTVTIQI